jgi:hypothetical protein
MLLGVDLDVFDIGAIEEGDFFIKFKLLNKEDGFKWALVFVYGPAQDCLKQSFLSEVVRLSNTETSPILIGGDFNILRSPSEKNNDRFDHRWPFLFNAVIDGLDLREMDMSGRRFTWANSRDNPTYEKLDRILVATEWEEKYPRAAVLALSRNISDHTPLLLSTGIRSVQTIPPFKFELGWFFRDGFVDMVKDIWINEAGGSNPLEKWQAKIRKVRQYLRGWAQHTSGILKKEKKEIISKLDEIDKRAESVPLSTSELDLCNFLQSRLAQLLREEEIKWYQRAKVKELLEGDSNTKYFHMVANGKHRKNHIFQMHNGDRMLYEDRELKSHITRYYKDLFGPPESSSFTLDEDLRDDIIQVT